MEKEKLNFMFDEEGDVLDISIGIPIAAISNEIAYDEQTTNYKQKTVN